MNTFGKLIATSVLALAPSVLTAETNLIFNAFLPPHDELRQNAIENFAKAIEKETNGSVTVTIPDTTLAPSDRQYEMVRDGIADMALASSGTVRQMVALNQIADLPLNSPSSRAASIALWETYQKYFVPIGEFKGVHVLATTVLPGRQVLSVSDKTVDSVDAFAGVKLWSPPGRLTGVAKALGAVPVNSEFTDLFEYVSKGTVDAVIMTPGSADGARILDNVKSIANVPGGLGSLSFSVFIAQERWDSLTDEERAAITRAAQAIPAAAGAAADHEEAELAPQIASIPTHVFEGDELAKLNDRLARSIEDWKASAKERGIENPDEVLAFYRSVLERELAAQPAN